MAAGKKRGNASNKVDTNAGDSKGKGRLTRCAKTAIDMTKEDEDFNEDSEINQTNGEPSNKRQKKFQNESPGLVTQPPQNEHVEGRRMLMELTHAGPVSGPFFQNLFDSDAKMIDLHSWKQKLSSDIKDLNQGIEDLEAQCFRMKEQYEKTHGELDKRDKQMTNMNREMENFDEKMRAKEAQLSHERASGRTLKQSLASIGHDRGRITDDVFRQDMGKLGETIHDWATKVGKEVKSWNFHGVAEALKSVPEYYQSVIRQAIPSMYKLEKSSKTTLVYAIVSAYVSKFCIDAKLVPAVFDIEKAEDFMEGVLRTGSNSAHEDELNQWRAITRRHLYVKNDREIQELTREVRENASVMLMDLLSTIFGTHFDAKYRTGLEVLFLDAIRLSGRLLMQRGGYSIEFPKTCTYDPSSMDDKFGNSDLEHAGKTFEFALFPALWKISDDRGQHINPATIVSNARVFWSDPELYAEYSASESLPHPMSKKEEQKPEFGDELGEDPAKDQHVVEFTNRGQSIQSKEEEQKPKSRDETGLVLAKDQDMVDIAKEDRSMQPKEEEQKLEPDNQLGEGQKVVDLTKEDQAKEANEEVLTSDRTNVMGGGTGRFASLLNSISGPSLW